MDKLRVIAYIRVSTDGQADGFGPDVQRSLIEGWVKATPGATIVQWCEDLGVSGSVDALDRDGLSCVLDSLADGQADAVVMSDLDRLGRRLAVSEAALGLIRKAGGRCFTVNNGEVGEDDEDETRILIRQVLSAINEFEARKIVKRMQRGRAAKASAGGFAYGSPAFGKRSEDGELVDDADQAAVLDRMTAMHAGGFSYRRIASTLNDEGVPTKRGGRWHPSTVSRALDPEAAKANRLRVAKARARTSTSSMAR